jgi:hypothetical protein
MPNTKPFVAAAFICEKVLQEKDEVFSAIRIVDTFTMRVEGQPLPAQPSAETGNLGLIAGSLLDLTLLVILKGGDVKGEYKIDIVAHPPDGAQPASLPGEWLVAFDGGESGSTLVVRFAMPTAAPVGLYWFDVIWQGETLTRVPLRLAKGESAETDSTEPR